MNFEGLGRGYTGVIILMAGWCPEDLWGELLPQFLAHCNETGYAVSKLSIDVHYIFLCVAYLTVCRHLPLDMCLLA